ncbi:argininosuccinate synthase domain-containing protein [Streptomyces sp. NPDC100445]|uniref:argininosuccinate synthase domain-containing protein n=1 Tax=Streptomyces sp. NPDC100445 TaxID=3366102 RepID=UPI00380DC454
MAERVVLAYSGGPDTSVAIGRIAGETGAEVVAVTVDHGQGGADLEAVRERALAQGAVEAEIADARDAFAEEYCLPAIKANAVCGDRHRLVTALSRPLIAQHLVAAAEKHGATTVAHGCTGEGDDRVRFEACVAALDPGLTCVPVRDHAKAPHPLDRDAFGCADGTSLPEDARAYPADPAPPREPDEVVVTFVAGVPVALDGRPVTVARAVRELDERAGAQGVGRIDRGGDRLAGTGSREVYQAPGLIALITAHRELDDVTVERPLARHKRRIERRWGELLHGGQWFSPLRRALDGFLDEAGRHVVGDVRMTLRDGRAVVTGRRAASSPHSPYDFRRAAHDTGVTSGRSAAGGSVDLHARSPKTVARRDVA